jgi:hypothetical protein
VVVSLEQPVNGVVDTKINNKITGTSARSFTFFMLRGCQAYELTKNKTILQRIFHLSRNP